ncbi:MAG: uncharacterized protein QOE55_2545 [Acidobacteriaceae bacterium]|nr:uncharacterized protein [Acidobacteriaceae bacterium]
MWDPGKASINLDKHGIAFEKACQVFFDPFVRLEDASDHGEPRGAAIGLTEDWSMLFVVHLWRENDSIRIVSARLATAQERGSYEDSK